MEEQREEKKNDNNVPVSAEPKADDGSNNDVEMSEKDHEHEHDCLYDTMSDHDDRLEVLEDRIDHLVRSHNALDSKIDRRCSCDYDCDYYPHGNHTAQVIAKLECELAILRANRRTIVDEVSDWVMKHRSGLIVLCLCAIIVVATIMLGDAYRGMQVMP
jgi:hypothetical protein